MNYLIWSNEHGRWWKPGRMGCTAIIGEAGRYSREEAEQICTEANQYRAEVAAPNEVMVLAPEAETHAEQEYRRGYDEALSDYALVAGSPETADRLAALEAELERAKQRIADLRSIANVNGDWTLRVSQLEAENQVLKELINCRAGRLLVRDEPFFVVKASEPYARQVVELIKQHEGEHWTEEDEQWAQEALAAGGDM